MMGVNFADSFEEVPDKPEQPAKVNGHDHDATWPVLAPAAYHGLAGEVVARILPDTESDPAALLLQYLVSFGNAVGRGPHYRIEQDRHFANLFTVLVGQTSKSRKGTSAGASAPSSTLSIRIGRASASSAACHPKFFTPVSTPDILLRWPAFLTMLETFAG
jgi:hypothetical protein